MVCIPYAVHSQFTHSLTHSLLASATFRDIPGDLCANFKLKSQLAVCGKCKNRCSPGGDCEILLRLANKSLVHAPCPMPLARLGLHCVLRCWFNEQKTHDSSHRQLRPVGVFAVAVAGAEAVTGCCRLKGLTLIDIFIFGTVRVFSNTSPRQGSGSRQLISCRSALATSPITAGNELKLHPPNHPLRRSKLS